MGSFHHPQGYPGIFKVGKNKAIARVFGMDHIPNAIGKRLTPDHDLPSNSETVVFGGTPVHVGFSQNIINVIVFAILFPAVFAYRAPFYLVPGLVHKLHSRPECQLFRRPKVNIPPQPGSCGGQVVAEGGHSEDAAALVRYLGSEAGRQAFAACSAQ